MSKRTPITERLAHRIDQLKRCRFPWDSRDTDLHEEALREIDRLTRENELLRARRLDRLPQELP